MLLVLIPSVESSSLAPHGLMERKGKEAETSQEKAAGQGVPASKWRECVYAGVGGEVSCRTGGQGALTPPLANRQYYDA